MEELDKNIGIYVITNNVNGKKYVGQSVNLNKRKQAYSGLKCKGQPKIYNSIKKYSWENFTFEIVLNCKIEELNQFEFDIHKKYFDELGADMMLNLCAGGGVNTFVSEETREKIRNYNIGKKRSDEDKKKMSDSAKCRKASDETKKKMSESQKGHTRNKGRKASDETKKKMGESQKGRIFSKKGRINQYNLENTFLKTWESWGQISDFYNKQMYNIFPCCNGKRKTAYGFIWKYEYDKIKTI